ncbi:hypothetical protein [Falsiroseomonas selenitidurans]|uniref:hypothetical protein n=1 Tax=Falsiroseomonas selenitidurans TaxID=2716335 RepID=UPI001F158CC1|nr:hypothetical protein [Falsiroseomonas selenitidurans]
MTPSPREPAEALRLPAVSAERLDAVLRAAGTNLLPALAVLICALGFLIARATAPKARKAVLAGVQIGLVRSIGLHGRAEGQG